MPTQLEAVWKQHSGQQDYTPSAAATAGEVIQLNDGRAAVVKTTLAAGEKGAVFTDGLIDFKAGTSVTFAKGEMVFWDVSADTAVPRTDATGAGDFAVGPAVAAKASGELVVRVDLNAVAPSGAVGATVADGTAVTNTTTETLSSSVTLRKEDLVEGAVFEFEAFFIATATNSTDTFTFGVRLDDATGGLLHQSAAVDLADGDECMIKGSFTVRTDGASGTYEGHGMSVNKSTAAANGVTGSIDTTANHPIVATVDMSVANAGNSAVCRSFIVKRVK